jgi:predicted transporter
LLLGVLGPVLLFIIIAPMIGTVTVTQVNEGLWILIFVGPAISLLGLTLFGLAALRSKPRSRPNWLPVLAGIWYPVTYVLFSVYDISHKGKFPDQYLPALVLMVVIQFLTLCILGFVLIRDSAPEMARA